MSKHIGKSLDAIANNPEEPMRLWLSTFTALASPTSPVS